jgi:aminotransferase EvaB
MLLINNLQAKIDTHQTVIQAAIERVVKSGWVVLGPEVKQFEAEFSTYLGIRHCIGVANGTDAIELALRAIGIGYGDPVATVANAGMYTTTALLAIGALPVFMEVDANTYCITLSEVTRAVEAGVKAVVVTHLFGMAVAEISAIANYCSLRGVPLLEDCAQAHGAKICGRYAGTFGDAASFSFYPTKNLGALGDGGAVVTRDDGIAERLGLLRQYGWKAKYTVVLEGARNSRLDEIQAAILREFLPYLDQTNSRRREIATRYCRNIRHPDVIVPIAEGESYVAHLFVVRVKNRDALRTHLGKNNIASDVHYPIPDHRQLLFKQRFSSIELTTTETLADEVLTLPCYPEMTDLDVDLVVAAINRWVP